MKASAKPSRTSARPAELQHGGNRVPRQLILGALLIALFAFGLRFGLRNAGMFHYDEVITVRALEHWQQTGEFRGETSGRHGFVLINGLFYFPKVWLTGNPTAERIPQFTSAIFGSLLCGLLVLLAYQLFRNTQLAFTAGLLAVVNPLMLSQGTIGKEHNLSAFFLLLALYSLIRYRQGAHARWLAFGSTALGIALSIREAIMVFVPLIVGFGLYSIWQRGRRSANHPQSAARFPQMGALVLLVLPFALLFLPLCFSTLCPLLYDVALDPTPTYSTVYIRGISAFMLKLGTVDLLRSLSPVGLLLALSGLLLWWQEGTQRPVLVLSIAWVLLFFYFVSTAGYTSRFLFELMPVFLLGTAFAITRIAHTPKLWVLVLTLLATLLLVQMLPLLTFRHFHNGPKEFALLVANQTEPDAVIIVLDEAPFIQYYANHSTRSHPIGERAQPYQEWVDRIYVELLEGTPFYALSTIRENTSVLLDYDEFHAGGVIYDMLARNFNLTVVLNRTSENYHHGELVPAVRMVYLNRVVVR